MTMKYRHIDSMNISQLASMDSGIRLCSLWPNIATLRSQNIRYCDLKVADLAIPSQSSIIINTASAESLKRALVKEIIE